MEHIDYAVVDRTWNKNNFDQALDVIDKISVCKHV
jgi:hypothetical protein